MAQFDQRGQNISGNQYNTGRDIHFGSVTSPTDLVAELEKLKEAITQAELDGLLDKKKATDIAYQITKASQEAEETQPQKKTIEDHLDTAKSLLESAGAVGGLVSSVVAAIETIHKLLP